MTHSIPLWGGPKSLNEKRKWAKSLLNNSKKKIPKFKFENWHISLRSLYLKKRQCRELHEKHSQVTRSHSKKISFENNKRMVNHLMRGNSANIINGFFCRNLVGLKGVKWYIQGIEGEKLPSKNTITSKTIIQNQMKAQLKLSR